MASEVISDIKIELSDLNNLCCHASLASKCLHEMIPNVRTAKDDPLTCVATPQVKMHTHLHFEFQARGTLGRIQRRGGTDRTCPIEEGGVEE